MSVEVELKFKIDNPLDLLKKIDGPKPKIFYVKDEIYGKDNVGWKVRKRTRFTDRGIVKEEFERTKVVKGDVKKVREEKIEEIPKGFKCENSYEKIRYYFARRNYEIVMDFYPIGVFCEIEGEDEKIKEVAEKLGFDLGENITENVDALYYKNREDPLLHWGFGKL